MRGLNSPFGLEILKFSKALNNLKHSSPTADLPVRF